MQLIDFEERYHEYAEKWIRENAGRFQNMEEMENHLTDIYDAFADQEAPWLGGISPRTYFARIGDAEQLTDMMCRCEEQGITPPDLLLDRLVDLGAKAVKPLIRAAGDRKTGPKSRLLALDLLNELEAREAVPLCLDLVDARTERDGIADAAARILARFAESIRPELLRRAARAPEEALPTWLDLLSVFSGDPEVYALTEKAFLNQTKHRAFYANLLGRQQDERALRALTAVYNTSDIGYLDYMEIANAIEALGGDAGDRSRDFSGDPDYEALRDSREEE